MTLDALIEWIDMRNAAELKRLRAENREMKIQLAIDRINHQELPPISEFKP